jgi:hypothetical protein
MDYTHYQSILHHKLHNKIDCIRHFHNHSQMLLEWVLLLELEWVLLLELEWALLLEWVLPLELLVQSKGSMVVLLVQSKGRMVVQLEQQELEQKAQHTLLIVNSILIHIDYTDLKLIGLYQHKYLLELE